MRKHLSETTGAQRLGFGFNMLILALSINLVASALP
jgi:hypothetical protein